MGPRGRLPHALAACLISLTLLVYLGLIGSPGKWYDGTSLVFRRQSDALLNGSLGLAEDPAQLQWDLAWGAGSVQQPWGLGVSVWRLPFESLARLCGQSAFPDRLALAAAITIVAYALLRAFAQTRSDDEFSGGMADRSIAVAVPLLFLLYPPFVTLCRTRFIAYEEAQAYGYLTCLALVACLATCIHRTTTLTYLVASTLGGVTAFVRPTLGIYGLATVVLLAIQCRRSGRPWHYVLAGPAIFGAGLAALCTTNFWRFGAMLEFGHQLTVNSIHAMRFASRFDEPFHRTPLVDAGKELFATLFLTGNSFNGFDWYKTNFFLWQAPSFRWRELYFKTYDLTFFVPVILSWLWLARGFVRRNHTPLSDSARTARSLVAWSVLSAGPLAAFYVRSPFIASRYLIDFAPAFAAAMASMLIVAFEAMPPNAQRTPLARYSLVGIVATWWIWETLTAGTVPRFTGSPTTTYDKALAWVASQRASTSPPLPDAYDLDVDFDRIGIPFNGSGWNTQTGSVKAAIVLFVSNPQFLELEVAPAAGNSLDDADYRAIQAKVGLEHLSLQRIADTASGRRMFFSAPQTPCYREGPQIIFVGFVEADDLSVENSKFLLLNIRWRHTMPGSGASANGAKTDGDRVADTPTAPMSS